MPFGDSPDAASPGACVAVEDARVIIWTATGLERQVFLDNTGRRGRRVRLAGGGMALLSAGWLTALVTGAIGFSSLPTLTTVATRPAPPPPSLHVATARHPRREVTQTAAVNKPSAAAARALARGETHTVAG